jgi:hypothetical protein
VAYTLQSLSGAEPKWGNKVNRKTSAMLLGGGALLLAVPAIAGTAVYDNFGAGTIDPAKWYAASSDYLTLDSTRQISTSHQLHLAATGYSVPQDDGGSSGGTYGLYFANPQAIKGVGFAVRVNKATATACPSNPGAEVVTGPEFRGRFFNTQASPTSQLGDVEFAIGLDRRPYDINNALSVSYIYQECANATCTLRNTLGQSVLGTVQPGTSNRITMAWDKAHHRFLFTINGQHGAISYFRPDASAPFEADKQLDVARVIVNCAAAPRPSTAIDVNFDNITVTQ